MSNINIILEMQMTWWWRLVMMKRRKERLPHLRGISLCETMRFPSIREFGTRKRFILNYPHRRNLFFSFKPYCWLHSILAETFSLTIKHTYHIKSKPVDDWCNSSHMCPFLIKGTLSKKIMVSKLCVHF